MKPALSAVSIALLLVMSLAAQHGQAPAQEGQRAGGAEVSHQTEPGEGHADLWKLANFVVMAGVLGYFIKKKAGGFFAARTAEIRRGLEEAAHLRKEAEGRYAEMEQRLANLGAEIDGLRNKARQESAAEGERIREEIGREMAKIHEQAEQEITAAVKTARQQLRAHAAELAVGLAAKRIRERLTPDSDEALIGAMLKDLAERPSAQAVRAS